MAVCLALVGFLVPGLAALAAVVAALAVASLLGGAGWGVLRAAGIIMAPLGISLLSIHSLFYPGRETVLFRVGPLVVWEEGVAYALVVLLRLAILVLALLAAVVTTHPKALVAALVYKGMSPKLAYVFLAAQQLVPDMRRRSTSVLEAQQARGLDVNANLWRRVRAFIALLGPLLVSALIGAETRSLALEARAFGRQGTRNYLVEEVHDSRIQQAARWGAVVLVVSLALWPVLAR
ncbi:MAG: energy-coupling factor transporter transmembrane protein EcfT [Actinomycetota bacterium]|nr:energy-coupling factor transporter transmembrane protein EcfT [Actinomycetota bacterium]